MLPKVCLFTDSLEPSGVGEHMLTLAAELRHRYTLSFVCPPTPAGQSFLARAACLGLQTFPHAARFNDLPAMAILQAWLCEQQPDLFHCHAGIGWEGFGGIVAARAAGVPALVRTEHLPYLLTHPIQQQDHAAAVAAVDRLVGVSKAVTSSYAAAGVPAHKLHTIRNGLPHRSTLLDAPCVHCALGLPSTARLVVTVGRFSEQKGHRYLLDALPAVLARVPDAYFLWVGSGELEDDLRLQAGDLAAADHLRFLGQRADVPALLTAADLFVLPSLFEGLPLVVLEAMAAGRPVVGTAVVGTSEAVADGVTGRLVPPRDGAALAAAILEVLEQPALAACWGAAGRARVIREFSAARMAAATAQLYDELLHHAYGESHDSNTHRFYRRRRHRQSPSRQSARIS